MVKDDGTFMCKNLGELRVLPGQPFWRVHRKNADDDWCLLCDKSAGSWNGHLVGQKHMSKENCAVYWMKKNGFGFLCKTAGQETDKESNGRKVTATSGSSACAAGTATLVPKKSSSSTAAMASWSDDPLYPLELKMAETRGEDEPIYKLTARTVRIQIDREDMPEKAVWLAVGRPGFLAFKEDDEGQIMDWMDPFCLLCGTFASYDHVGAVKHVEKTKSAAVYTRSRGYGEVVDWIDKNAQEVIHVASASPVKIQKPVSVASDSDDDGPAPGTGLIATLPFAKRPFDLLEVDLSKKKKKDHWGPMDPAMAEEIGREAQKGEAQFEITPMVNKKPWVYKIDFKSWTQENLETGTVRKFRFAETREEFIVLGGFGGI